jgi:hypothetical protein
MKKLQIPKINPDNRVKCVLLAILGVVVGLIAVVCNAFGMNELAIAIITVVLAAAAGAVGYFVTGRVILPALCIAAGPACVAGVIAFPFSLYEPEIFLIVFGAALILFPFLLIPIIPGGLLALAGRKIYVAIHRKRYGFDPADDLEIFDEDERTDDEKKKDRRIKLIVYPAFVCSLLIINFVIFVFKAEEIYMPPPPGSYFWGLDSLIVNVMLICIFAVVAIALKMIFNKKIKFSILILCALMLPTAQSQIHDKLFDYGGILHSTIEEGGIFYPIYESMSKIDSADNKHEDKDIWKHCHFVYSEVIAYGRGPLFESSIYHLDATAQPSHYMIAVDAGFGSIVEYFEVYLTPRSDVKPEQVRIWVDEEDDDLRFTDFRGARVELSSEILPDGRIKLTLVPIVDHDIVRGDTMVVLNYDIEEIEEK